MKRKELTCGMQVERQRGEWHNYPSFCELIVLAVEPWEEGRLPPGHWLSKITGVTRWGVYVPVPSRDGKGQLVACAMKKTVRKFDDDRREYVGDPVTTWKPVLVPLRQLVPAGTKDRYEAERAAARERDERVKAEKAERFERRQAQEKAYAAALGLKPGQVLFSERLDSVTIPTSMLDGLMSDAGVKVEL